MNRNPYDQDQAIRVAFLAQCWPVIVALGIFVLAVVMIARDLL